MHVQRQVQNHPIYIYICGPWFGLPMVRPVLLHDVIFGKKIILQYKGNFASVYCLFKLDSRFS